MKNDKNIGYLAISENANDGLLSGVDRSYIHYTPSTNVEKLL